MFEWSPVHIYTTCIKTLFSLLYSEQAEARRTRTKEARKRREERLAVKRQELLKSFIREDEEAPSK